MPGAARQSSATMKTAAPLFWCLRLGLEPVRRVCQPVSCVPNIICHHALMSNDSNLVRSSKPCLAYVQGQRDSKAFNKKIPRFSVKQGGSFRLLPLQLFSPFQQSRGMSDNVLGPHVRARRKLNIES